MRRLGSSISHRSLSIILLLLAAVIWFSGNPNFVFTSVAELESNFPGTDDEWTFVGPPENVDVLTDTLYVAPNTHRVTSAAKRYTFPTALTGYKFVRISGRVSSGNVIAVNSETLTDEISIFLTWFQSREKERFWVETVTAMSPLMPAHCATKTILIPPEADSIFVGLLLREFSVEYFLSDVQVQLLSYSDNYKRLLFAAVIFTVVMSIYLFFSLSVLLGRGPVVIFTLVIVSIAVGIITSGNAIERYLVPLYQTLNLPIDRYGHPEIGNLLNIGHVVAFFVLSLISFILAARVNAKIYWVILNLLTFVLITEALQRHRVDRLVEFGDIILDLSGIFLGAVIWKSYSAFRKRLAN